MGYPYYYHTTDRMQTMAYPHYSDDTFSAPGGACIFGADEPGLSWDYDDRLWQWDREKAEQAAEAARVSERPVRSAARIETFLSAYLGRPVTLVCVMAGTRQDNGYAWYAYGYR